MMRPPSLRCFSAAWVAMKHAAQVEVDHLVHLFQRRLLERLGDGRAGVVHQHVEPAEGGDGLFDRGGDGLGVGGVRLDRDRFAAGASRCL